MKSLICIVTVWVFAAAVLAQSPDESGPIRNAEARGALIRHERAVEQARQTHLRTLMDLDRALIRDLETALAAVTRAGNLDEAIRIRTAKGEAEQQLAQRQAELTGRAVTPSRDLAQSVIEQRTFTHYRVIRASRRTFVLNADGTIGGEAGDWSQRWSTPRRNGSQYLTLEGVGGEMHMKPLGNGMFLGAWQGLHREDVLLIPE